MMIVMIEFSLLND